MAVVFQDIQIEHAAEANTISALGRCASNAFNFLKREVRALKKKNCTSLKKFIKNKIPVLCAHNTGDALI